MDLNEYSHEAISDFLRNLTIRPGGYSRPDCSAKFRVALVIPYRDREPQLRLFVKHMHPFLTRQQLDYAVFVVEAREGLEFNRALLMNVGFLEALRLTGGYWECFVFHDVDLLPEDERNLYTCGDMPVHMSAAVSTHKYK